jgi:signal transduction histidine kinase
VIEGPLAGTPSHAICNGGREPAAAAPLAAYIAHELRTPLATQRALLELALADPDTDPAIWRDIGRDVLDACNQQERLLEACLALSRSQAALGVGEIVDIASVSAGLLRTIDLDELTARVFLEPALTMGDPALIERMLDNLLTNAVRHNRVGGWIAVTTGTQGRRALVAVENTGPRIRASELARLFEPFQRRRSPNAQLSRGFGLGLAIVNSVADAHGARITARTRALGGLRIEVAFALPPTHGAE